MVVVPLPYSRSKNVFPLLSFSAIRLTVTPSTLVSPLSLVKISREIPICLSLTVNPFRLLDPSEIRQSLPDSRRLRIPHPNPAFLPTTPSHVSRSHSIEDLTTCPFLFFFFLSISPLLLTFSCFRDTYACIVTRVPVDIEPAKRSVQACPSIGGGGGQSVCEERCSVRTGSHPEPRKNAAVHASLVCAGVCLCVVCVCTYVCVHDIA